MGRRQAADIRTLTTAPFPASGDFRFSTDSSAICLSPATQKSALAKGEK